MSKGLSKIIPCDVGMLEDFSNIFVPGGVLRLQIKIYIRFLNYKEIRTCSGPNTCYYVNLSIFIMYTSKQKCVQSR